MDEAPLWSPVCISPMARAILGVLATEVERILFEAWVEGIVKRPILSTCPSPLSLDGVSVVFSVPELVYLIKIFPQGKIETGAEEEAEAILEYVEKILANGLPARKKAIIDIKGNKAERGDCIWMKRPAKPYRRNTARTRKTNSGRFQKTLNG